MHLAALMMALIPVAMTAIMTVRVITSMRVIVTVRVLSVGAVFRIERRFHRPKSSAEPAQHVLDHMIAPNAQPIADDLHIDMPVADVPSEPRQFAAVGCGDFNQRLRPADDAHDAAVVEHEAITVTQCRRLRQVEQEGRAALAGQNDAAAMALMRIERNLINGAGAVPMASGPDCMCASHVAHKACCGFNPTQF